MLSTLYIKQSQWIRQRLQNVWSGERKIKALLRVVLQREIKQGMVAKWQGFFFAISFGKGICYCKYYKKPSGKLFAEFIEHDFLEIFKSKGNPTGNVFVQDGDPSQNSNTAKTALDKIGAAQFSIPPRSPDLNPIENAFNLVKKKVSSDAVKYSISKKSYAKFVQRVENTLLCYHIEAIDDIIKSMPKRISQVIQSKSHCLKY